MVAPRPTHTRPVTVTAAVVLLILLGITFTALGVIGIAGVATFGAELGANLFVWLFLVTLAALGVGLLVAAAFISKGNDGARIRTFVAAGVAAGWFGLVSLVTLSLGAFGGRGVIVAALVAVIWLLATPSANAYFRGVSTTRDQASQ